MKSLYLLATTCILIGNSYAGVAEDYERGFAEGLPFKEYQAFNARSTNRVAKIKITKETDTYAKGLYQQSWLIGDSPRESQGAIYLDLKNGQIAGIQQFPIAKDRMPAWDVGVSGQVADVVTTGAALSQGFAEANPLGIGLLPAKIGLLKYAKTQPLFECMADRAGLGVAGWGLSGWNLAFVATGAYPIALAAGVATGYMAAQDHKQDPSDAAFACVET